MIRKDSKVTIKQDTGMTNMPKANEVFRVIVDESENGWIQTVAADGNEWTFHREHIASIEIPLTFEEYNRVVESNEVARPWSIRTAYIQDSNIIADDEDFVIDPTDADSFHKQAIEFSREFINEESEKAALLWVFNVWANVHISELTGAIVHTKPLVDYELFGSNVSSVSYVVEGN